MTLVVEQRRYFIVSCYIVTVKKVTMGFGSGSSPV